MNTREFDDAAAGIVEEARAYRGAHQLTDGQYVHGVWWILKMLRLMLRVLLVIASNSERR